MLVTTYQAGKLVMLRPDGGHLNTHFRAFSKPMGLAVAGDRLAIGTRVEIWEYHNAPAVARGLEPAGRHDACFLPRSSVCTGDVQIHEMAWADDDELWFVNTRFSCLCTHSFVPRWKASFVSALAPEDRCHLNGLGLVGGRPGFVTALGTTDTRSGWRENRATGGVLMDVASGEVVCRGLSMPHSPRWYDGRLWVLESGGGGVGCVDPATGKYEAVAVLPGFTRGLDFCGPRAFVGLSQVRESAVFSSIAVAERPVAERCCGVWVLDSRTRVTRPVAPSRARTATASPNSRVTGRPSASAPGSPGSRAARRAASRRSRSTAAGPSRRATAARSGNRLPAAGR